MPEDSFVLKSYIERIAAILHDHLDAASSLEAGIGLAASGGGSEGLRDSLASIGALRESIIESIEQAVEVAARIGGSNIDKDDLLDLYALVAYYLEAGLWREESLSREAYRHLGEEESSVVYDARKRVEKLVERLEKLMEEAGIDV